MADVTATTPTRLEETLGRYLGGVVREAIGRVIEQLCRFADARVCALANLTDDAEAEETA